MSEIIADYRDHHVGEREVVDWTRPDGDYHNVPVMYLRRATFEEWIEGYPNRRNNPPPDGTFYWEVSVD